MKRLLTFLAAFLAGAGTALAQDAPRVSLAPAASPRWDVSAEAGWLGSNKSRVAPDWNDWIDVAAGGAALGYYVTPHLRSELRFSFSGEGRFYEEQPLERVPGLPYPVYRPREHRIRTQTLSGGLAWQFFENGWFHPSLGGGFDIVNEREAGAGSTRHVRPFAATGFKWYVNERAFTRTDVRVSFAGGDAAQVTWTAGFGVDL
jgi:hypothetical protein